MRVIYEAANMIVDIVDDFCDYQILNIDVGLGALGLGFGPSNCDLISYGLHGSGFLANGAGALLIGVGGLVGVTGIGAPIGLGLIGIGGLIQPLTAPLHVAGRVVTGADLALDALDIGFDGFDEFIMGKAPEEEKDGTMFNFDLWAGKMTSK